MIMEPNATMHKIDDSRTGKLRSAQRNNHLRRYRNIPFCMLCKGILRFLHLDFTICRVTL